MAPWANSVIKIICGPDSGIIPIRIAKISTMNKLSDIHFVISKYCNPIWQIANVPNVHKKIDKA